MLCEVTINWSTENLMREETEERKPGVAETDIPRVPNLSLDLVFF